MRVMLSDGTRIIFQDVDGCLNPADGEAFGVALDWEPSQNQVQMLEAIDAAVERSPVEHFVINTGRPWPYVKHLVKHFKSAKARYVLVEHACVLYDRFEECEVDCASLAEDLGLSELAIRYRNLSVINVLFDWYDQSGQAQLEQKYGGDLTRIDKLGNLSFVVPDGVEGESLLSAVESLAKAQLGAKVLEPLEFLRSDRYIDILPGIHKLDGIHLLSAYLKVDLKHALAMGDYLNDLSVFESFSRVLCPANAHPQIQKLAQSKGATGKVSAQSYGVALLELLDSL